MNIRKEIDYSAMHAALEVAVSKNLPQMELYCEIGKAICARTEKGAAVAAASYLSERYPNMAGFSPRNVRRMRDFYRLYGDMPELLTKTLRLNWTQNVVIMEAELTAEARIWYIDAALRCNPTKAELLELLASEAHLQIPLGQTEEYWYNESDYEVSEFNQHEKDTICVSRQYLPQPDGRVRNEGLGEEGWLGIQFHIESAATSREEIGNPVYPPARRKLTVHGISCEGHAAQQLTNQDYEEYDLLIGMDQANLRNMYRICGGDFSDKMSLLMEHTDHPGDVADPWYTGDFEATWQDVLAGCQGLLKKIEHMSRGECDE